MRQDTIKTSDFRAALRAGDRIWGGIGIGAASLSACFAAYMLVFGPAETSVRNAGDFGLFARMRSGSRFAESNVSPILRTSSKSAGFADGIDGSGTATASNAIDFAPTGSLDGKPQGGDAKTPDEATSILLGTEKLLPSYIVRDVFDGRALVETPSTLTLVSKGSIIAGAGEVLSIERRGRQWAVVTSGGVIGTTRPNGVQAEGEKVRRTSTR